jgi:hypothetical protein
LSPSAPIVHTIGSECPSVVVTIGEPLPRTFAAPCGGDGGSLARTDLEDHEFKRTAAKGNGWYSFDQNGVHFVGLENVANLKSGGLGAFDAEQLAWLADDLKAKTASTPIVLFAHIPGIQMDRMAAAMAEWAISQIWQRRCSK